ncbi:MAG: hypothetical protein AB7N29_09685 [Vicinamibacterales bacterium]
MRQFALFAVTLTLVAGSTISGQTNAPKEEFTAVAIVNNNLASGLGRVIMQVSRWSSEAERTRLAETLLQKGPDELLDVLRDNRSVGTIRTPDSLGYDLRYAHQEPGKDGGRRIVIATDRPISFWEARNQPRTIDYPFTVIQMEIGPEGKGKGTMSYATKITVRAKTVELENFASSPVMLTEVEAKLLK